MGSYSGTGSESNSNFGGRGGGHARNGSFASGGNGGNFPGGGSDGGSPQAQRLRRESLY